MWNEMNGGIEIQPGFIPPPEHFNECFSATVSTRNSSYISMKSTELSPVKGIVKQVISGPMLNQALMSAITDQVVQIVTIMEHIMSR